MHTTKRNELDQVFKCSTHKLAKLKENNYFPLKEYKSKFEIFNYIKVNENELQSKENENLEELFIERTYTEEFKKKNKNSKFGKSYACNKYGSDIELIFWNNKKYLEAEFINKI